MQLGVFSVRENALKYIEEIKRISVDYKYNIFSKEYKENNLFKVFAGPFVSVENAKNIADNLLKHGYNSILITKKENK